MPLSVMNIYLLGFAKDVVSVACKKNKKHIYNFVNQSGVFSHAQLAMVDQCFLINKQ